MRKELQSVWSVIENYYNVWQVLQSETSSYYKVWQVL